MGKGEEGVRQMETRSGGRGGGGTGRGGDGKERVEFGNQAGRRSGGGVGVGGRYKGRERGAGVLKDGQNRRRRLGSGEKETQGEVVEGGVMTGKREEKWVEGRGGKGGVGGEENRGHENAGGSMRMKGG